MVTYLHIARGPHSDDDTSGRLATLLAEKGVPQERTTERAAQAIKKLGAKHISEALHNKNAWSVLKALGSQPANSFQWIKPDELALKIQQRAASNYGIWLAHWNNVADYAAKEANRRHSEEFHTLWSAYSQTERDQLHRLACLQELHLAVAATNAENQPTAADGFEEYDLPADADPEPDSGEALVSWPEVLSPDWAQSLPGSRIEFKFDSSFPRQAITWLLHVQQEEEQGQGEYRQRAQARHSHQPGRPPARPRHLCRGRWHSS